MFQVRASQTISSAMHMLSLLLKRKRLMKSLPPLWLQFIYAILMGDRFGYNSSICHSDRGSGLAN
ncbi:hypothetical protein Sjap_017663 [Stephania japonica]|uniref:Uncharacterized protein n=1 Tax=Stephania japonica TaxID=461633 RepID=A0AAP0I6K8_9MAGN